MHHLVFIFSIFFNLEKIQIFYSIIILLLIIIFRDISICTLFRRESQGLKYTTIIIIPLNMNNSTHVCMGSSTSYVNDKLVQGSRIES